MGDNVHRVTFIIIIIHIIIIIIHIIIIIIIIIIISSLGRSFSLFLLLKKTHT